MGNLRAYSSGQWLPSSVPPGVITKGASTTTFSRGVSSVYVDNDSGGWQQLVELFPSTPVLSGVNNSGRIDLSWTITSTANVQKYEVYHSADGVTYSKWTTEPSVGATSAIFGRVGANTNYRFFIRAVAYNGLYRDSNVVTVPIGGVTAWKSFSHSRSASGWHTRSFTFTAGASTSSSTITNISATLKWRQNTSQAWTTAATYSENNVLEMTKTFSFSAYDYGQRMFRVEVTLTDNQTLQDNGTTGTGYQFSNYWDTTDLTAADIAGGVPTISGSAPAVSDPGLGGAAPSRSLNFVVGFDANVDRSEYDSANIILYRTSDNASIGSQTVNLAALKTNQAIRQELTYSFTGLPAGTAYYAHFNVYDDQGVDRTVRNDQTTYATQSTTVTYVSGAATTSNWSTANAGDYRWLGSGGEYIGDAPYGPQYTTSKNALRDGNDNSWYLTTSMGTAASSTTYQRIRIYKFEDFSINTSSWSPGNPGYGVDWLEFVTPQTHQIYAQMYDYKGGSWLGYEYPDPNVGEYYIARNDVNGTWRLNLTKDSNWEGLTTQQVGNNWYVLFDIRAIMTKTKVYTGLTGYRVGLSEVRARVVWYNRYDTYTTTTYYW